MPKRNIISGVDPEFLERHRASLLRHNRHVLYFNDKELEAIRSYCEQFGVKSRSALMREAIMEKVLSQLDESHPTLF